MSNNPFSTTFGIEPNNHIKRIKETEKIISDFSADIVSNYVYIITGLRGSGKTVLLSSIYNYFSQDDNWIVVDPGPKDNILENIASEIYETAKLKKLFLKKDFSFSFHGLTFSLSGEEPVTSINALLKKMLTYLKDRGKRVLITIDEVDNSAEMKYFIQAYQSLLRLQYPVFLLMTGLYDNISKLQEDKSLTFLYRAPKIVLPPLNINSIAVNYRKYLKLDEKTSLTLAALTKGYAYAYQVLGYLMFDQGKKEIDDDIMVEFEQYLTDYVYDKLFSELSEKEQEFLFAFTNERAIKVDELRMRLDMNHKAFSVYRDRLIKKGVIVSPKYAYLELSLPRFSSFLNSKRIFLDDWKLT